MSVFNSPYLLGFDQFEHMLESIAKNAGEGYPPYNIEHMSEENIRITLALAGFTRNDIAITLEAQQLVIRGKQTDDTETKEFLHRGIAARQFVRKFVLADGMEITDAFMENGLLHVDLHQPRPDVIVQNIPVR
jgi:HSP20 family molecular chaperone IbpA